jgi:hypothetical protein
MLTTTKRNRQTRSCRLYHKTYWCTAFGPIFEREQSLFVIQVEIYSDHYSIRTSLRDFLTIAKCSNCCAGRNTRNT